MPTQAKPHPTFNAVILSKADLVKQIVSVCYVSERTAYRIVSGEKKVRDTEMELLQSIVQNRITTLQQAV